LILGLFSLISLISLMKCSWVTVEIQGYNLIYTYRSFFKKQHKVFPASQIKKVEPKVITMWNQQKMEKLFLILSCEELVLSPFYFGEDENVVRLRKELSQVPVPRDEVVKRVKPEKKAKHPSHSKEESKNMIWAMIEMSISCPRCDSSVMVNGPFTKFACPGCGESIDFTPEIWTDLLEDTRDELVKMDEGEGGNSTIWGTFNTSITYGRLIPYCKECKKDYDLWDDYSEEDMITCPDCGSTRPIQEPPEWFNQVFEGARLLIGVSPASAKKAQHERDLYMTCPSCGASILVSGTTRNEKCKHCDSSVLLPDELWQHLHPQPVKIRWFVGFMT